jgi:multicomponent Na+:H+ antiporter subunit B
MRRLYAILVAAGIIYMLFSFLTTIPSYGNVDLSKRVSAHFLTKDVNEVDAEKWIKGDPQVPNSEKVYGEKGFEDGSANVVTSVVVNYRSFDTLGEVTVLFTAAVGIGLILGGTKRMRYGRKANFILRVSTGILLPLIIMFGVYIFVHGHLTPGGGFPGGTIIAAAILLLYLSNEEFDVNRVVSKSLEGTMGSLYVIIGLAGLAAGGAFLFNFMPTGVVGALFSAGVVPVVYSVIGLKVGSELAGVVADVHSEREG